MNYWTEKLNDLVFDEQYLDKMVKYSERSNKIGSHYYQVLVLIMNSKWKNEYIFLSGQSKISCYPRHPFYLVGSHFSRLLLTPYSKIHFERGETTRIFHRSDEINEFYVEYINLRQIRRKQSVQGSIPICTFFNYISW